MNLKAISKPVFLRSGRRISPRFFALLRMTEVVVFLSIVSHWSVPAFAGNESSGGGFVSTFGSGALLNVSIEGAIDRLDRINPESLSLFTARCNLREIAIPEMMKIIKNTRRSYTKEKVRKNPEGVDEPLFFDYGVDEKGRYIEALKPFFTSFVGYQVLDPIPNQVKTAVRMLIHEASHHFGYSEAQAQFLSDVIVGNKSLKYTECP